MGKLSDKAIRGLGVGLASLVLGASVAKADVVAEWKFDEGIGNLTYDLTGNGNTGTLQNGVSWTSDSISGYALSFDGIDDRVSVVKTPSVDLTSQVTLDAYIKRNNSSDGTIFSRNGPFFMAVKDDKIYGGIHTTGGSEGWTYATGTTDLQANQWYNVSMSYDGSQVKVFVNGVEEGANAKTGIMEVRSQQPWIGWGEPGQNQYFSGVIDEVRIHNTAIPEPSSVGLLALGGLGSLFALKRRK